MNLLTISFTSATWLASGCGNAFLRRWWNSTIENVDQLRILSHFDFGYVVQVDVSAKGLPQQEGQGSDIHEFHGILPAELEQKLCHVLIEQQESQIMELESDLHLAQSKLNEKEAELQALKDCVRRLTEFSLSTVSGRTS